MMWELDPRVRKFVTENLFLPEWDLTNGLAEKGEFGIKKVIDQTIKKLNDAMGEADMALSHIKTEADKRTKEYAEGGWPYPLIGGGTWFDTPVARFTEATTKTYELRALAIELVAASRGCGILPKFDDPIYDGDE